MLHLALAILFAVSAAPALAGQLVVLNKSGASASILDAASGAELARLDVGVGPHEVAVSPDGGTAVVANYGQREPGNTLSVIDLAALEVAATIDLGENRRPHGILYIDSTHVLVTTEDSGRLLEVDVPGGEIVASMETGGRIGHMVAVTADARQAFVPHMFSNSLACFDLESGRRTALVDLGEQPEGIDVRPGHDEVWVTNRASNTVSVVSTETHEVLQTLECADFPIRLKFTPDGRHALVSNARSGDVSVFDADSREEIHRIAMLAESVDGADERLFGEEFAESPTPVGIVVSPDGKKAWVANTNADVISVLDLELFRLVGRLTAGDEPDGMAFVPSQ